MRPNRRYETILPMTCSQQRKLNAELLALVEKTKMPIDQEGFRRTYGPPPNYEGTPPEGSEIFIIRLPKNAFEQELVPFFEKVGRIYQMSLIMDVDGFNRGYGYVKYFDWREARNAINSLNNSQLRPGYSIGVCDTNDYTRIYLRGIPPDKTEEEIVEEMSKFTPGAVSVYRYVKRLYPFDLTNVFVTVFIQYDNHGSASLALTSFDTHIVPLWGLEIGIEWARPEDVPNMSRTTSWQYLEKVFNKHSSNGVLRVRKMEDQAYITLRSRDQALEAILSLSNSILDNVQIQVTMSNSRERWCAQQRLGLERLARNLITEWQGQLRQICPVFPNQVFPIQNSILGPFNTQGSNFQYQQPTIPPQQIISLQAGDILRPFSAFSSSHNFRLIFGENFFQGGISGWFHMDSLSIPNPNFDFYGNINMNHFPSLPEAVIPHIEQELNITEQIHHPFFVVTNEAQLPLPSASPPLTDLRN